MLTPTPSTSTVHVPPPRKTRATWRAAYQPPVNEASAVIYRGPSTLDPAATIKVVVSNLHRPSSNDKTGDMLQVYIIPDNVAPTEAVKTGADASVCGDCMHRGSEGYTDRTCYVNLAPVNGVHRSTLDRPVTPAADVGRRAVIRVGAYGDPAAVPVKVWQDLLSEAARWTGYTEQWLKYPELRHLLMASVQTDAQERDAQALGWRTFRAVHADHPPAHTGNGAIWCPAAHPTRGKLTSCESCGLCSGKRTATDARRSIRVEVHGRSGVPAAFARKLAKLA